MKISNSKKQLAKIINENRGWYGGANWAAQDKDGKVFYYAPKPSIGKGREEWASLGCLIACKYRGKPLPNWHQTILSRDEYFHLYPAQDEDRWIEWKGGKCPVDEGTLVDVRFKDGMEMTGAPVGITPDHFPRHLASWGCSNAPSAIIAYRLHKPEQAKPESDKVEEAKPTIEQLAADYRNLKDYADRKQQEADAAEADADAKLAELVAAGKALGLVLSVAEPELVITDWRDLQVGDVVEVTGSDNPGWVRLKGVESLVTRIGPCEDDVSFCPRNDDCDWAMSDNTEWRFIRRPSKGGADA